VTLLHVIPCTRACPAGGGTLSPWEVHRALEDLGCELARADLARLVDAADTGLAGLEYAELLRAVVIGFGRSVASEIQVPNILVNMLGSG
jgi:hypothetical protein